MQGKSWMLELEDCLDCRLNQCIGLLGRKLKIVLAGNVTPEVESSDSKKETGKAGNGQDKVKKENILVPDIKTVENVCKKALEQSDHKFALKESYIHFHLCNLLVSVEAVYLVGA